MTLKSFVRKSAQHGIAVWDKLFHADLYVSIRARHERVLLRKCCPKDVLRNDGLNLFLEATSANSIAKTGRDFALKLSRTSIPFSVVDITASWSAPTLIPDGKERTEILSLCSHSAPWRKTILFGGTEKSTHPRYDIHRELFYEFDQGLSLARPRFFKRVPAVCVFSDFCRDLALKEGPIGYPIRKIRYPFLVPTKDHRASRHEVRKRLGIPDDAFAVFFNFSFSAIPGRKNPEAVVKAFSNAFKNKPAAWLVLKTSADSGFPEASNAFRAFLDTLPVRDHVKIVDSTLEMGQILDLTAAMDVYLSLHRGEGLGLGMLEAMSLGVPVVATGYGGNMEFMNEHTSFPIPFERHVWTPGCGFLPKMAAWAEPDIDEASRILNSVFEDASETTRRVKNGLAFVREYYSLENFEKDVKSFLKSGQP